MLVDGEAREAEEEASGKSKRKSNRSSKRRSKPLGPNGRPMPEQGKRHVLFRPPNSHSWHASIRMSDGYTEDFNTGKNNRLNATTMAVRRIRDLYVERGIPTPAAERKRKGELSAYQRQRRMRLGLPLGEPVELGRPPKAKARPLASKKKLGRPPKNQAPKRDKFSPLEQLPPKEVDLDMYEGPLTQIERDYARGFLKILEMMAVGLVNDPLAFTRHVRAIMVKALQGKRGFFV